MGMSRRETELTLFGEMLDLIACRSIDRGLALPKTKKKTLTDFEKIMRLA